MAKINLSVLDRDTFNVTERPNGVLIVPTKGKQVWAEEELHLRSLLTDKDGYVLSSGWPKFRNYGEDAQDDEEFRLALQRGAVQFSEKLDGSLIIVDHIGGGNVFSFRTRGNHCLGEFEAPVMALIEEKYPRFYEAAKWAPIRQFVDGVSLLFEYVAPTNRIVVRYEEAELYLLGWVDRDTLTPGWDAPTLALVADVMGVPLAPVLDLPQDFDALMPFVRSWMDKEGTVARFVTRDGRPKLLKIKASQYVKLHAIKFKLEGKVAKLAALLGIWEPEHAAQKLYDFGVDWEAQTYIKAELDAYFAKLDRMHAESMQLRKVVQDMLRPGYLSVPDGPEVCGWVPHRALEPDTKEHRKEFVAQIRGYLKGCNLPQSYFNAAMSLYDGDKEKAWVGLLASEVMGESYQTVLNWLKNPTLELDALVAIPSTDD